VGAAQASGHFLGRLPSEMIGAMRNAFSIGCLALVLLGCGASSKELTDKGAAALGSGDARSALESFDGALKQMSPSDPDYLRASMGRCQALARLDPNRAKEDFLALARSQPGKLREQDYAQIADELVKTRAASDAIDVMDAGVKAFPESPQMQVLKQRVVEASKKSKDPAALGKLKGLGYTGDDGK
jgi:hypothetical protein